MPRFTGSKRKRSNKGYKYTRYRTNIKRGRSPSPGMRMGWTTNNNKRIRRLERMIETKEGSYKTAINVGLAHNQVTVLQDSTGVVLNPFRSSNGASDDMEANNMHRIGDSIAVKGLMIRGFFENAMERPKVYYRFMVVKCAKNDTIDRTTLYKGDCNNKMIDQINTERFNIVAQKTFNINCTNVAPTSANGLSGAPQGTSGGGPGTRTFKMWIPGRAFGKSGVVQYENGSFSQLKFFDYRLVIVVYDWFGTPQDLNTVGRINELYTKLYFKDA